MEASKTYYGEDIDKLTKAAELIKETGSDYLLPPITQRIRWMILNDFSLSP